MKYNNQITKWRFLIDYELDILRQQYMAENLEKISEYIMKNNLTFFETDIFTNAQKILLKEIKPLNIESFINEQINLSNKKKEQVKKFENFKKCFPDDIPEEKLRTYFWNIYQISISK